ELLMAASVIGQEFRFDLLQAVAGLARGELLDALGEATAARLVETTPDAGGRARFTHAVVREVVYARLGAVQRTRLHHRVGEVIEMRFAAELEPRVAELAHHFLRSGLDEDAERGLVYAIRAGRRAMQLLAHEEAAEHFERALQALQTLA